MRSARAVQLLPEVEEGVDVNVAVPAGTLLAMMIVWLAQGKPQYVTMDPAQDIAYVRCAFLTPIDRSVP